MPDIFTPSLLLSAIRVFAPRLTAVLHSAGHTNLRPRHLGIFAHLDVNGVRFRTLAERTGLGTSGMGALVDELERFGYLQPRAVAVGRAQLLTPTRKAINAMQLVQEHNATYEMELQRLLGSEAYESFRRSLELLATSENAITGASS